MLEDGTIFLAEAWIASGIGHGDGSGNDTLTGVSKTNLMVPWNLPGTSKKTAENAELDLEEYLSFSDVDAKGLKWMDLARLTAKDEEYYMMQASDENRYVISLQPVE